MTTWDVAQYQQQVHALEEMNRRLRIDKNRLETEVASLKNQIQMRTPPSGRTLAQRVEALEAWRDEDQGAW